MQLGNEEKRQRLAQTPGLAMTPVTDEEDLEMFHTPSAPAFLEQEHRRQHANAEAREPAAVA